MEKTCEAIRIQNWMESFGEVLYGAAELTQRAILQDLSVFIAWWEEENMETFDPEKLTNWDMHAFHDYQVKVCRVAAATWNRRRSSLARFADWCQSVGYLQTNVMRNVRGMKIEKHAPSWPERKEFARLMRQVEININTAKTETRMKAALRDQAMVGLMAYAGLRESEVVNLVDGDVVVGERSGHVLVHAGKGSKQRIVPLSREARRLIAPWLETRLGERRLFDVGARAVQKRIKALGVDAKFEGDLTPHRLRHYFAKRLLDQGVSLDRVAVLMGHQSLESTKVYTIPSMGDLSDAVELI